MPSATLAEKNVLFREAKCFQTATATLIRSSYPVTSEQRRLVSRALINKLN